jgi:D-alanyl-D-alanine carboxypeptidase
MGRISKDRNRIVHFLRPLLRKPSLNWVVVVAAFAVVYAALAVVTPRAARAEALLLIEADTGKVLQADNATMPWYPASLSKMMTAYVTLKAVKDGRITLDTLFSVSAVAASQSPSKMGFKPGTQLTVDNALKMMLVKSANDMAVVLAEGVGGSIDGFAAQMNQAAQRLGMTQTSYVNPNGLPADGQITSARDLAILARAIIRELPEYEYFVHIPAIRFGRRVTQNFNKLIGRYPGADGFKTGFICASGYNLVGSATRDGKRLIAVVLGASSGTMRAVRAAQLLDRGFANNNLSWLRPSLGTVDQLAPIDASPPNLREEMCSGKHKHQGTDADEEASAGSADGSATGLTFFAAGLQPPMVKPADLIAAAPAAAEPITVYTGPTRTGAALIAAVAADTDQQNVRPKGKKARHGTKKADAEATDAGENAKSDAATKPAGAKHANAKPDAAAKSADQPAAKKPAKPKAAAKPPANPAPKSGNGDAKPAG